MRNYLIPSELEAVSVEISKPQSKPFFAATVYRPPKGNADFFEHLGKFIKAIDNNQEIYLLGDLNCNLLKTDNNLNAPTKKIKSLYELYQLSQIINQETRVTVTNTPEKIFDSGVIHTEY